MVELHKSVSVVGEVVDGLQIVIHNIIVGSGKDFWSLNGSLITLVSSWSMRFF